MGLVPFLERGTVFFIDKMKLLKNNCVNIFLFNCKLYICTTKQNET